MGIAFKPKPSLYEVTRDRPFLGDLARPLESIEDALQALGPTPSAEKVEEIVSERQTAFAERERLLLEHFGAPSRWSEADRWHLTARLLAERFVPGFREAQPRKKVGAPTKWDAMTKAQLRVAVDDLRAKETIARGGDRYTIEKACHELSKSEPWRGLLNRKSEGAKPTENPGAALERQYRNADKTLAAALRGASSNWLSRCIAEGGIFGKK